MKEVLNSLSGTHSTDPVLLSGPVFAIETQYDRTHHTDETVTVIIEVFVSADNGTTWNQAGKAAFAGGPMLFKDGKPMPFSPFITQIVMSGDAEGAVKAKWNDCMAYARTTVIGGSLDTSIEMIAHNQPKLPI